MMVCIGRFPGPIWFGWPGVKTKPWPAVLEHHPRLRAHKPAAVGGKERIDEADRVALFVDDGDVDGVLVLGPSERRQVLDGVRQVDLRRQFIGQAVGQKIIDRNLREPRIADECVARGVSEARRFDLDVEVVDIERIGLRLEARQDVQNDQGDNALTVGRAFVDRPATILRRDRLDVLALGAREIVRCVQAANALEIGDHVLGDRPIIEGGRPFAANGFQRLRRVQVGAGRPDARALAVAQKG